jgi:NADH-quinone oxidoreductase subunit N
MVFNSPTLEYSLIAPILIILGGALIGVLIEAFVGKTRRPVVQLGVALATLVLALIQVIRIRDLTSTTAAMGSVVIDGPGLLFQGAILIIAIISIFLIADQDNFTSSAAALPGSEEERQALSSQCFRTTVYAHKSRLIPLSQGFLVWITCGGAALYAQRRRLLERLVE